MINRGANFKQMPLNIVGSSTFGRYPKISVEKTTNMMISDGWLVPYPGYQIAISYSQFQNGSVGRALHSSAKFNRLIAVIDANVYLINIFFDQNDAHTFDSTVVQIGQLETSSGVVYIAENNKPQILFSDNVNMYLYDPTNPAPGNVSFQKVTNNGAPLSFTPGFIDFHDTYFLCAASSDNFYTPPASNTWRLSGQNDGLTWADDAASIGLLQTEPDKIKAVVRVPSKGDMVLVMGSVVSEPWYDVGYALFPYQRSSSYSIDYGCLNPATIASMDEMVVWLAQNTKSGPIIMFTMGGEPEKITTDGIDYLFSQLNAPEDSQGFLYRQDGHLIYHINFYTDNLSLFYDFNTKKFFHACDQNGNYFIANEVAFFNNQYYFLTKQNGNLYAFDTIYTTYETTDALGNVEEFEIPRSRICAAIRETNQEAFVANDVGFTIEQGTTNYYPQTISKTPFPTVTDLVTQNGNQLITQNGFDLIINEGSSVDDEVVNTLPVVYFSASFDGGYSFSSDFPYVLNSIGNAKNKLMWWQGGWTNDYVCQFRFAGIGRFVAFDGIVNIRK